MPSLRARMMRLMLKHLVGAKFRRAGNSVFVAANSIVLVLEYRLAAEHPFPAAMQDSVSAYRWLLGQGYGQKRIIIGGDSAGDRVHPDIGLVHRHERLVPMRFAYWNPPGTAERLLDSGEWKALRNILVEFREQSLRRGITPVAVYLPHKIEIYAELVSDRSGAEVRERLRQQLAHPDNSVQAFRTLSEAVQVPLIDVTPQFRAAAREGRLLYYPFDTHWNPAGRELAAQIIAEELHKLQPKPDVGSTVARPPQ